MPAKLYNRKYPAIHMLYDDKLRITNNTVKYNIDIDAVFINEDNTVDVCCELAIQSSNDKLHLKELLECNNKMMKLLLSHINVVLKIECNDNCKYDVQFNIKIRNRGLGFSRLNIPFTDVIDILDPSGDVIKDIHNIMNETVRSKQDDDDVIDLNELINKASITIKFWNMQIIEADSDTAIYNITPDHLRTLDEGEFDKINNVEFRIKNTSMRAYISFYASILDDTYHEIAPDRLMLDIGGRLSFVVNPINIVFSTTYNEFKDAFKNVLQSVLTRDLRPITLFRSHTKLGNIVIKNMMQFRRVKFVYSKWSNGDYFDYIAPINIGGDDNVKMKLLYTINNSRHLMVIPNVFYHIIAHVMFHNLKYHYINNHPDTHFKILCKLRKYFADKHILDTNIIHTFNRKFYLVEGITSDLDTVYDNYKIEKYNVVSLDSTHSIIVKELSVEAGGEKHKVYLTDDLLVYDDDIYKEQKELRIESNNNLLNILLHAIELNVLDPIKNRELDEYVEDIYYDDQNIEECYIDCNDEVIIKTASFSKLYGIYTPSNENAMKKMLTRFDSINAPVRLDSIIAKDDVLLNIKDVYDNEFDVSNIKDYVVKTICKSIINEITNNRVYINKPPVPETYIVETVLDYKRKAIRFNLENTKLRNIINKRHVEIFDEYNLTYYASNDVEKTISMMTALNDLENDNILRYIEICCGFFVKMNNVEHPSLTYRCYMDYDNNDIDMHVLSSDDINLITSKLLRTTFYSNVECLKDHYFSIDINDGMRILTIRDAGLIFVSILNPSIYKILKNIGKKQKIIFKQPD